MQTSALRAWIFERLHSFVDGRLAADVERQFSTPAPREMMTPQLQQIR
jgi:hypothetical protein